MIGSEAELFGSDAWSPELMVEEISHPLNYYLVARTDADHEFAGYAGLRAAPSGADSGDIQTIAVVPHHRGKGLGRTLLRALLDEARNRGAGDIFLEVRADNPAAISLYESEGFHTLDRRVGYYQPDGVDALVMRRSPREVSAGWAQ
jgi:ribosomal-protein-alanine acetyltransferase